ncbi:MAG: cytochrome-c oxidase, cbb3-type subunit III [Xanthomonadales bacterium]|jgi:cytochrome c oxidase cbb3-type subunit 3|nr:cytochrome-c oxidase, cbb3-type subunit III [Xanthomonadales bacterium]
MEQLNTFWNWFVIVISLGSIFGCWWLLHWTKGVGEDTKLEEGDDTGHVWDENIKELNTPLPRWWLHMFNITIVFALVYLAFFPGLGNFAGQLGWTQEGQWEDEMAQADAAQEVIYARFRDMSPEALMADTEAMDIAGRLFGQNCAMCHGSDGGGARGFPALNDGDWQWGGEFDQVIHTIANGRQAMMTPFGAVLGDAGVKEVTAYVQTLSGQKADAELAAAGEKHFKTICMACHGMDGKGMTALGAPNLTDDIWLYGSDPADIEYAVINGLQGYMPGQAGVLSNDETRSNDKVRLLAAYVIKMSEE